jgi:hypothetical protein
VNEDDDVFAERDAFGLTSDDWMSFLGYGPEYYSGPAMLWWALAGVAEDQEGPCIMREHPFLTLLTSVASDARALATLASSSHQDDVRALAPALHNLHRRITTAAQIAVRMDDLNEDEDRPPGGAPSPPRALPSPKVPARPRGR